jgi:hypothetical protein
VGKILFTPGPVMMLPETVSAAANPNSVFTNVGLLGTRIEGGIRNPETGYGAGRNILFSGDVILPLVSLASVART